MSLGDKRALIVGMGGLGSPAALVLARAGVGHLTLVDDDEVDVTNLQRQILFREEDVGRPKAEVARERLLRDVAELDIVAHVERVEAENAAALFAGHDVVLDGSDNFQTKFLCSDVAMRLAVPLVHAGALRFAGQLLPVMRGGACVRCLFEHEPPAEVEEIQLLGPPRLAGSPRQRPPPGQRIDQRRLAHVGAPGEGDLRQPGRRQLVQPLGREEELAFGGEQQAAGLELGRRPFGLRKLLRHPLAMPGLASVVCRMISHCCTIVSRLFQLQ